MLPGLVIVLLLAGRADTLQSALLLEKQGRDAEAAVALERLIRQEPAWEIPRLEAARLHLKLGSELELVEMHLEAARSLAPENPRGQFLYGQLMEERRQSAAALEAYRVALELRSDYDEARFRLAGLKLAAGDFVGAAEAYRAYVKAHPEATGARLQLAVALEKSGAVADAEHELKAVYANAPTRDLGGHRLADLYDRTNRHKEAARLRETLDGPKKKLRPLR